MPGAELGMNADRERRPVISRRTRAALIVAGVITVSASLARAQEDRLPPSPEATAEQAPPFLADELEFGAAAAPVLVVEYISVTCVHCAAFDRDTWPRVRAELIDTGRVRWVVREMPTAPVAVSAAGFMLARCAGASNYWKVVERLFKAQRAILSASSLPQAIRAEAKQAGLTEDQTRLCLSDPTLIDGVNTRRQQGLDRGVDATPYFLFTIGRPGPKAASAKEHRAAGELSFPEVAAAVARIERNAPVAH